MLLVIMRAFDIKKIFLFERLALNHGMCFCEVFVHKLVGQARPCKRVCFLDSNGFQDIWVLALSCEKSVFVFALGLCSE